MSAKNSSSRPSARLSASAPLDGFDDTIQSMPSGVPGTAFRTRRPRRLALSFEVIPPRHDADEAKIDNLLATLNAYKPDYISVTSSARSQWLTGTTKFIKRISANTQARTIAHLACTAGTRDELTEWIYTLLDSGVRGFLALRGDLPEGVSKLDGDHLPHATDLVRLIREIEQQEAFRLAAGNLAVSVACYPSGHAESASPDEDLDVLLAKQRLGADFAITQLFFEAEDFLRFEQRARLAGVRIPLIPGIMPMTSLKRAERMGVLSGISVPDRVYQRMRQASNEAEEFEIGMEMTVDLARTILEAGTGGLHIYTHNNAEVTQDLLNRIGIPTPDALR
ncbi:methylenetetrahydrofolate reductase [Corynebacterium cystitidis]|uniref:Methylenetetrahydrofolate reductase n=1 Tax=Corynebacterium cystitidis DSM 20524 TaxID=1121357 RepID=A0A1H9UL81_9CORY|nr:methylenetetrahydrofolate reductase [Corynebacterium cystitidis]WJY81014.1 5,10-methylenetetrahydrofolate reductase [Corynebacterium cystitidis DSM 20524]SES10071.1 methylenetetrahydrofolate reductase (NADPH) [Corynebacterium cystitidis DSM 20524]SNV90680.1 5,10-methylenetetrahydrofolate reductase [Corynebacterium cystitidis]